MGRLFVTNRGRSQTQGRRKAKGKMESRANRFIEAGKSPVETGSDAGG
jgi:hypothetical protein